MTLIRYMPGALKLFGVFSMTLLFLLSQNPLSVSALSADQKRIFDSGIYFFDADETGPACTLVGSVGASLPAVVPEPYNGLFSQAASDFKINPQLLAAVFLSEHANTWEPFDTNWATSSAGAQGPFQFMPTTWDTYQTDGNNDGIKDINNVYDAAYSAASLLHSYNARPNSELGALDQPYKTNTMLQISASYNWGPGNVQIHTTPSSSITGDGSVPIETQNYIKNVYALITSGFTKSGVASWSSPTAVSDLNTVSASGIINSCSSGVVAGDVAQTALNLSWPGPHSPPLEPKPEYTQALNQYNRTVVSNGADCGVFVATVMHASGADPNYPASGTSAQDAYVRSHPDKYQVIQLSSSDTTAIFQPGDILIVNTGSGQGGDGHTMIFVGSQSGGYNEASASLDSRMPNLGTVSSVADDLGRGYYVLARLK